MASGFDDNRNMDDRYSGPAGGDTVLGDESVSLISSVACGAIIHGLEVCNEHKLLLKKCNY